MVRIGKVEPEGWPVRSGPSFSEVKITGLPEGSTFPIFTNDPVIDLFFLPINFNWSFDATTQRFLHVYVEWRYVAMQRCYVTSLNRTSSMHRGDNRNSSPVYCVGKHSRSSEWWGERLIESSTSVGSRLTNLSRGWYDVTNTSRGGSRDWDVTSYHPRLRFVCLDSTLGLDYFSRTSLRYAF